MTHTWNHRLLARLTRDVDGDTYYFDVDVFDATFHEDVREYGIDTAEIFGVRKTSQEYQRGMAEKQFVVEWLAAAGKLWLLTNFEQGEYGRWLCDVENEKGEVLSQVLLDEYGESVRYE